MKTLTVKVIAKEISGEKGKFTTYAVLTEALNWYSVSKIDRKELDAVKGQIVNIVVSRKFDKQFTKNGKEASMPTLVVEHIETASPEEVSKFIAALDKHNATTLVDVK